MDKAAWRHYFSEREAALRQGEIVSETYNFNEPPVDVFRILKRERRLIHAVGDDFGNAFDGRIRYVGNRFLLCCNTRYDKWQHSGKHHSRVVFSIAHELGHYFLDHHRRCLVANQVAHDSFSEFSSHKLIEAEADHFASGLLMPSRLMKPQINQSNFPDLDAIRSVRKSFDVSLTGLLARWTQLSDFPCATIATRNGKIEFGWTSEAFQNLGCFKARRGHTPECKYFRQFVAGNKPVTGYAEGEGTGSTDYWIELARHEFTTSEMYFAIPHTGLIWVFVCCDETDISGDD